MITLDLPSKHSASPGARQDLSALRRYVPRVQRAIGLGGRVHVLLTTDDEIRRLNRTFLRKDKPTDVLSFPAWPLARSSAKKTNSGKKFPPHNAGDIAISMDRAARQAAQFGHSLAFELRILLLHGLLHLAGHDHEADGGEMAKLEAELRHRFRLPDTLIIRSGKGVFANGAGAGAAKSSRPRAGRTRP